VEPNPAKPNPNPAILQWLIKLKLLIVHARPVPENRAASV
jgi:hypothetical protein